MKIKEVLVNLFTKNIPLKLISLAAAFIIWIIFITVEDPVTQESFRVPLTVSHHAEYEESDRYITAYNGDELENSVLSVTLRARRSVLKELSSSNISEAIEALVDVFEEDNGILKIHYSVKDAYKDKLDISSLTNASYIEVASEEKLTKRVALAVMVSGKAADGSVYFADDADITASAQFVDISGPKSKVDEYYSAQVNAVISGEDDTISLVLEPQYFNEKGKRLTPGTSKVTASLSSVEVSVPIYTMKEIPVTFAVKGEAPKNFVYLEDAGVSADKLKVYGKKELMASVELLRLPTVSLSDVKGSYKQSYSVSELLKQNFGEGIRVYSGPETIEFSLTTEEMVTETFAIPVSRLNITGLTEGYREHWTISFDEAEVSVTLVGLKDQIDSLKEDLSLSVNLTDAELAETTLRNRTVVLGELPDGVTVKNVGTVTLIIRAVEEPEPTE